MMLFQSSVMIKQSMSKITSLKLFCNGTKVWRIGYFEIRCLQLLQTINLNPLFISNSHNSKWYIHVHLGTFIYQGRGKGTLKFISLDVGLRMGLLVWISHICSHITILKQKSPWILFPPSLRNIWILQHTEHMKPNFLRWGVAAIPLTCIYKLPIY